MSSPIWDMFPFCVARDGRRMPELIAHPDFRNTWAAGRAAFESKFPGPYRCSQCRGKLELCAGGKNATHFRHSALSPNCGGTSPFHDACVKAVLSLGRFRCGAKEIRFDAANAVLKTRPSSSLPDLGVRSSDGRTLALEIDFSTSAKSDFGTGFHSVYRADANRVRMRLEKRFWEKFDPSSPEIAKAIASAMLEADFRDVTGKGKDRQTFLKISETKIPKRVPEKERPATITDRLRGAVAAIRSAFSPAKPKDCPVLEKKRREKLPDTAQTKLFQERK